MYDFKIYESLTEELEILWIKLEKKSNKNFFQSFDYIKSLVELEKNLLRIVVVFTNNEPVAIFPFEIKNYFIFKVLQWIGTKKSDLCNPIILQNVDLHKDKDFFLRLNVLLLILLLVLNLNKYLKMVDIILLL